MFIFLITVQITILKFELIIRRKFDLQFKYKQ